MAVCHFKVSDAAIFAVNVHSPIRLPNARNCEEGKKRERRRRKLQRFAYLTNAHRLCCLYISNNQNQCILIINASIKKLKLYHNKFRLRN